MYMQYNTSFNLNNTMSSEVHTWKYKINNVNGTILIIVEGYNKGTNIKNEAVIKQGHPLPPPSSYPPGG